MRGIDERPVQFFSYVDIEGRVPPDHPLRLIRALLVRKYALPDCWLPTISDGLTKVQGDVVRRAMR